MIGPSLSSGGMETVFPLYALTRAYTGYFPILPNEMQLLGVKQRQVYVGWGVDQANLLCPAWAKHTLVHLIQKR